MSKRNFILLIIVLIVVLIGALWFLYYRAPSMPPDENGGTNFISNFNPFGKGSSTSPKTIPPVDISGKTPENPVQTQGGKLIKVSSMPIAGYGIFMKERYKEVELSASACISRTQL